jgi:hypothetical protein
VKDVRVDAFPSSLIYYLGFNTQSPQQPALAASVLPAITPDWPAPVAAGFGY